MDIMILSGILMILVLWFYYFICTNSYWAIGLSSIAGILLTLDLEPALITSAQRVFSGVGVFTLLAIPFFILAGNIMNKGGIALRLINLAKLLLGKLPGGLAASNILVVMFLRRMAQASCSFSYGFYCRSYRRKWRIW